MLKTRGLDASTPARGALRACYDVAVTALMLSRRESLSDGAGSYSPARHAAELHRVSGALHRIAERECNENWPCPACEGEGYIGERQGTCPATHYPARDCKRCSGHGTRNGRKVARLRTAAEEIAKHYGLIAYFQTDPRGCSLYLVPEDIIPRGLDSDPNNPSRGPGAFPKTRQWIEANYTRGRAVVRVGR